MNFENRSSSTGRLMFFDADPKLIFMWAKLSFAIIDESVEGQLSNFLIFDTKNNLVRSEKLVDKDIHLPISGKVKDVLKSGQLTDEFKTDIGTYGKLFLNETDIKASDKLHHIFRGDEFKSSIIRQEDSDKG